LRLTIVQYAGDYREAFNRFAGGGKQTYYAQRYSVDFVGRLAQPPHHVSVICAITDEHYDTVLGNGVRAIGAGLRAGFRPSDLLHFVVQTRPTRLCLAFPFVPLLKWADRNGIPTIAILADSFEKRAFLEKARQWRLAYYLNRRSVQWVGNHGISACLSLLKIGVAREKIIPWDWPSSHRPSDYAPRTFQHVGSAKLLYVGSLTEAKGVSDLLRAVALLKKQDLEVQLSVVGRDHDGSMSKLSQSLGLADRVDFLGILPNEDVPTLMRKADIVIVPSRHEYPEGLPLTIYEALSARTPIIASDHPMFRSALVEGKSALIFPAGNEAALAKTILRLLQKPELYASLSINSEETWNSIQLPVKFGDLLAAWLAGEPDKTEWIHDHRLVSGRYDYRIREITSRSDPLIKNATRNGTSPQL
jgi:glycosyltransferase involved in cell wall biosynthesis